MLGEPVDNLDCPLFVFHFKSRLISRVSVRSCITVKLLLQSTSLWSRGLVKLSSVHVQRIMRLKMCLIVFMSVVSHGFNII